jgi:DNA mismatch endonuclease, patch repair protein
MVCKQEPIARRTNRPARGKPLYNRSMSRPAASDANVRHRMSRTPGRDNPHELALRSLLHRRGLRFRVHVRLMPGSQRTADIVFPSRRVVVYLDGCFWHGCPLHGTWPKLNAEWWRAKIEANRRRDLDTNTRLSGAGWRVVRVWEHEDLHEAANRIELAVRSIPIDEPVSALRCRSNAGEARQTRPNFSRL